MIALAEFALRSNHRQVPDLGGRRPAYNAHHPATAERVRVLFTETVMPRRAIAWEVGVSVASIHRWEKRFGWVRPAGKRWGRGIVGPDEIGPAPRRVSRGGKARFYPPDLVAEARRLVEETVLTRGAIAQRIGVSTETIRRWRNAGGWVRPPGTTARMSAEAMAIARRHCERSEASQDPSGSAGGPWVASSASPPRNDGGVGASVVDDGWHGGMPWRDALLPRGFVVPQNRRASSGKARPYMRPVVERVRELVEGTALSQAEIAARTGIGSATVAVWMREKGWRRPLDAYRAAQAVPADRAGLSARLAAGFARVAALAGEDLERLR